MLILSSHPKYAYAITLLNPGAKAYLEKTCEPEEIVEAARGRGQRASPHSTGYCGLIAAELEARGCSCQNAPTESAKLMCGAPHQAGCRACVCPTPPTGAVQMKRVATAMETG